MKEAQTPNSKQQKFGMVIDLDKCTGCGACMVACNTENNAPFREDETEKLLSIAWMRVYRLNNGKSFPDADSCFLPRPCQQCEGHGGHSPCVSVCPAVATSWWWNSQAIPSRSRVSTISVRMSCSVSWGAGGK